MEPFVSEDEGVWLKGRLISHRGCEATPRCVLIYPAEGGSYDYATSTIALCKKACLQPRTDNMAAGIISCCPATTALVECRVITGEELLEESMGSRLATPTQDLCLLLACDQLLDSLGLYDKEEVWFSRVKPLPLERVVLMPTECKYAHEDVDMFINQLYKQVCGNDTVIATTGHAFLHQLHPLDGDVADHSPEEESLPWMVTEDMVGVVTTPPLSFNVIETSPILQGVITSDTSVVILPFATPPRPDHTPEGEGSGGYTSDGSVISLTPPTYPSHVPRNRTVSASDINYFDDSVHVDMTPFVNEPPISLPSRVVSQEPAKLVIEARLGEEFGLLSHYVVLPKPLARKHSIWELQNIVISAYTAETLPSSSTAGTLSGSVLCLNNRLKLPGDQEEGGVVNGCGQPIRKRLAIARVYDSEEQLQCLVPHKILGRSYREGDQSLAYLHPELLFNLFPETLCPGQRRYYITIENLLATPSPSPMEYTRDNPPVLAGGGKTLAPPSTKTDIQRMILSSVSTPTLLLSDELVKELIKKHLVESQNKIVINKNDAFSLNTEHGKLILRVINISPDYEIGGISGDEFLYAGHNASYLPHLYYPSCPSSYWTTPLPPGLEGYGNTLFQYLLPNLMPKSDSSPVTCTAVMVSGPPGVGKGTVIRSVARRCRMNVKEFNCYDFFSEGLKAAEQKLLIAFEKAIHLSPCIMVLKDLQVLTKQDLSTNSHEPRLDAAFETHVAEISKQIKTSNFPVIVLGVTSQLQEVSPRLQHCFLHELHIHPPTQQQREDIITGLTLDYPISRDVDVTDLARRSAGFVLGDYLQLFTKAHKLVSNEITALMDRSNYEVGWVRDHHMTIFGALLSPRHLEAALGELHSAHSGYIGAPKIPNVKWSDVGGLEQAKKEILDTIQLPLLHPELFAGGLRRSGILLYGAPGTGKTLLAKAVATECALNFLSVKGPELINMYVGQTEENIREIFSRARGAAPCVVFFDELDSLAPNRGKSGDSGGVMDRVVSQLLAELDGLDQKKDVFVIGATNRPDLIDPALLRPGRFDRLVYLDVCEDMQSKLTILKAITRKFNLSEDVDLSVIARDCPSNLTGADLYALCADAMLSSLRQQIHHLDSRGLSDAEWNGSLIVSQNDFLKSLRNLSPSVTADELEMYRKKQFLQN